MYVFFKKKQVFDQIMFVLIQYLIVFICNKINFYFRKHLTNLFLLLTSYPTNRKLC